MFSDTISNRAKCSCNFLANRLGKPPEFALGKPPLPPSMPFSLDLLYLTNQQANMISIKNSNDVNFFLKCKLNTKIVGNQVASNMSQVHNAFTKSSEHILKVATTSSLLNSSKIAYQPYTTFNTPYDQHLPSPKHSLLTTNPNLFITLIVAIVLISLLLLLILGAFVFVYLTKLKTKNEKPTSSSSSKAINSANLLNTSTPATVSSLTFSSPPLTPFSTSPKSNSTITYNESQPSSNSPNNHASELFMDNILLFNRNCEMNNENQLKLNLNSFKNNSNEQQLAIKHNNDLIKLNKTKLLNLIDATTSTIRQPNTSASMSSSNSSNHNFQNSSASTNSSNLSISPLANNTSKNKPVSSLVNCANENSIKNLIGSAQFNRVNLNQRSLANNVDAQQHYYESIGDASQFYFDVDDPMLMNSSAKSTNRNLNPIILAPKNLFNGSSSNLVNHYPITFCSCTLMRMSDQHANDCSNSHLNHHLNQNFQQAHFHLHQQNDTHLRHSNSNNNNESNQQQIYLKSLIV